MHDSDFGIGIDSGINPFSAGIQIGTGIRDFFAGIGIRDLKNAGIGIGTGIKTCPESCITDDKSPSNWERLPMQDTSITGLAFESIAY